MKQLKTIYEYLNDYTKEEIDNVIKTLMEEEKELIKFRYGNDLSNPVTSENWDKEKTDKFYGCLIPKMKRLLKLSKKTNVKEENKEIKEGIKKEEIDNIVIPSNIVLPSKNDLKLIEELKNGITNKELCEKYNMTPSTLYEILLRVKEVGINISKKYYSNGTIKYKTISNISELNAHNLLRQDRTIITNSTETEMKFLAISDLHFGNKLERIDMINRAFNYCAKNNINNILCGGDFIDGTFSQGEQNITDVYRQVEYFIKNYPYDKNILTYGVGGDHDFSAFKEYSLNLIDVCNNLRHDIIIAGYNNSIFNIKNDKIQLYHHIDGAELIETNSPIILHGHSHKYVTNVLNDVLNVTIPSLSNIHTDIPGALEINVIFKRGLIDKIIIKHVLFADKDIIVSENIHDVSIARNYSNIIKNEENYTLSKTMNNTRLSQVDKFNKKYSK